VLLAFAVVLPGVVGLVVTTHVGSVVGLVVTAGLGVHLAVGLLFSYVAELVPNEVGATAVALLTAVGLGGAGVAPVAAGVLIERVGYRSTFLVAGAVGAAGVALAWRAPEPAG
jgi:MFS family permease